MRCHRCHSMMFPVELRDGAGGLMNNEAAAWRCFACGEIVDQLIVRIEVAFSTLKSNGPREELAYVWGSWALADNAVYRSH